MSDVEELANGLSKQCCNHLKYLKGKPCSECINKAEYIINSLGYTRTTDVKNYISTEIKSPVLCSIPGCNCLGQNPPSNEVKKCEHGAFPSNCIPCNRNSTTVVWPEKKEPVIVDQGKNNRIKDKAYVRGWNACHDQFMQVINRKTVIGVEREDIAQPNGPRRPSKIIVNCPKCFKCPCECLVNQKERSV